MADAFVVETLPRHAPPQKILRDFYFEIMHFPALYVSK